MLDKPMKVEACSIGRLARNTLQRATMFTVVASFARSFYLTAGNQLVCVAHESLYDGPFNLLTRTPDREATWSNLEALPGEQWTMREGGLSKVEGPDLVIDLGTMSSWRPRRPSAAPLRRDLAASGIDCLRRLALARAEGDGLLNLVLDPRTEPAGAMERAAVTRLQALPDHVACWIEDGDLRLLPVLQDLLGLGPGLTPSGDDLIAGFMIAGHAVGRGPATLDLWRRLAPLARKRTHSISFAHLAAAGAGLGAAPLHDLLAVLIENRLEDVAPALEAVARIGHGSGRDALGGMILLLEAWIAAGAGRPAAA
jgi:hypothetical protein